MDTNQAEEDKQPGAVEDFPLGPVIICSILVILLLIYGIYGLVIDDLRIPVSHSTSVHYHGIAAWIQFGALLSFSAMPIVVGCWFIFNAENVKGYARVVKMAFVLGIGLCFLAALCN